MNKRARLLCGVGVVVAVIASLLGGLSTGYGLNLEAVLLRIGIGYVVLGLFTVYYAPVTVRRGLLITVLTVIVIYAIGSGLMIYDLLIDPPEFGGSPLTASRLVTTQSELVCLLLPVPAGYLSGILVGDGQRLTAAISMITSIVLGAAGGITISLIQGNAFGLVLALFATGAVTVGIFALFPLFVMADIAEIA